MREAIKLCFVTPFRAGEINQYKRLLQLAIQGGITSVQLRAKMDNAKDLYQCAVDLKKFLQPHSIPLIINDHIDIAMAVDADGIHLGQNDIPAEVARKIVGPTKIIGLSIESVPQLEHANQLGCIDYVAASAVFPSRSKPDCKTLWYLDGLSKITQLSRHPVVAIGGIHQGNIHNILACGAQGVAVIGAIQHATCPQQAASRLSHSINHYLFQGSKPCRYP